MEGLPAELRESLSVGTGIGDQEAYGTFDWIVDFADFADMVTSVKLNVPGPARVLVAAQPFDCALRPRQPLADEQVSSAWSWKVCGITTVLQNQVVGCGTSTLSEDLLGVGYEDVTSVDIDPAQIQLMNKKTAESHPALKWIVADMTCCSKELPKSECFELIFDKGTLDALLCTDEASHMTCEVIRLLAPGGVYAVISFRPKDFIEKLLRVPGLPLYVSATRIPLTSEQREAHLFEVRKTASCAAPAVDAVKRFQDEIIKVSLGAGPGPGPGLSIRCHLPRTAPGQHGLGAWTRNPNGSDDEADIVARFAARLPAGSARRRLSLPDCHEVLFDAEMRGEYGYDLEAFRTDVEAFLKDTPGRQSAEAEEGLSLEEALDFLGEMQ